MSFECRLPRCRLTEYDLITQVRQVLDRSHQSNFTIQNATLDIDFKGVSSQVRSIINELYQNRRRLQVERCSNITVSDSLRQQTFEQFSSEILRRQVLYLRALSLEETLCLFTRAVSLELNYYYYPLSIQNIFADLEQFGITSNTLNTPASPPAMPSEVPIQRKKSGFWFFFFSACSLLVFIIYWTFDPRPKKDEEQFDSI